MLSLKAIRNRIASVKNTQKITKAMKLVSAAKLRRAQEKITSSRPYANKMKDVVFSLASRVEREKSHQLLTQRKEIKNILVLLITSDRGMCGGFNANVIRQTESQIKETWSDLDSFRLSFAGKKGHDYFKKQKVDIEKYYEGIFGQLDFHNVEQIAGELVDLFTSEKIDEVFLIFNEFKSAIVQNVIVEKLLPIEPEEAKDEVISTEYIYEPKEPEILSELLPKYISVCLWRALLESNASEHGARMTAMDNATTNCIEMIDKLTLQFNRARQASITTELMEIVGGAEALKQ